MADEKSKQTGNLGTSDTSINSTPSPSSSTDPEKAEPKINEKSALVTKKTSAGEVGFFEKHYGKNKLTYPLQVCASIAKYIQDPVYIPTFLKFPIPLSEPLLRISNYLLTTAEGVLLLNAVCELFRKNEKPADLAEKIFAILNHSSGLIYGLLKTLESEGVKINIAIDVNDLEKGALLLKFSNALAKNIPETIKAVQSDDAAYKIHPMASTAFNLCRALIVYFGQDGLGFKTANIGKNAQDFLNFFAAISCVFTTLSGVFDSIYKAKCDDGLHQKAAPSITVVPSLD